MLFMFMFMVLLRAHNDTTRNFFLLWMKKKKTPRGYDPWITEKWENCIHLGSHNLNKTYELSIYTNSLLFKWDEELQVIFSLLENVIILFTVARFVSYMFWIGLEWYKSAQKETRFINKIPNKVCGEKREVFYVFPLAEMKWERQI